MFVFLCQSYLALKSLKKTSLARRWNELKDTEKTRAKTIDGNQSALQLHQPITGLGCCGERARERERERERALCMEFGANLPFGVEFCVKNGFRSGNRVRVS